MMMPANFSAVSENEMTYVMGGSVADYLAPAMGAAQWQNFHKNLITIVGNKYVQGFLDNTVGAMFSGAWVPGNGLKGFGASSALSGMPTTPRSWAMTPLTCRRLATALWAL